MFALGYDTVGRLETVTSYGSTHTHSYVAGTATLASLTTKEGTSTILTRTLYHDRMGRVFGINTTNSSGTPLSHHGYILDDAGRRTRATRENGQRWDYGYDDVGQVTSGVKKFPNGDAIPGHTFAYQYDGIGNRSSATHGGTGTAVTYTPNALNQYDEIETGGGRFILGEAPPANDVFINGDTTPATRTGGLGFYWKQITGDNSSGPLWSTDSVVSGGVTLTGHAWTPEDSVNPAYDFDGNLTNDGRWDYTWDAENRLIRMTTTTAAANAGVPRQRLDFVYDSQGRRVSKTVSTSTNGTDWTFASNLRFLYDGWNLIAEYSPLETGNLKLETSYLWGLDLSGTMQGAGGVGGLLAVRLLSSVSESSVYPAYDGNGNISAWIGGTGAVLARMDYSPFGQLIAHYKFTSDTTLSRLHFGFSTKYTDPETGLLYYGHRYYDPLTGRWPSRDPIEEEGGLNLYGFVGNDGVNLVDVTGLYPTEQAATDAAKVELGNAARWSRLIGEIQIRLHYALTTRPPTVGPLVPAKFSDAVIARHPQMRNWYEGIAGVEFSTIVFCDPRRPDNDRFDYVKPIERGFVPSGKDFKKGYGGHVGLLSPPEGTAIKAHLHTHTHARWVDYGGYGPTNFGPVNSVESPGDRSISYGAEVKRYIVHEEDGSLEMNPVPYNLFVLYPTDETDRPYYRLYQY